MLQPAASSPSRAAGDREQKALGHELTGKPPGGSTKRRTDGELLVTRRGARRQETRHVQAHDEQEHRHRRRQEHERGQHVPAEHLLVGTDAEPVRLAQRAGMLLLEEWGEGFELRRRRLRGTVRSQPAQELVVAPDALRIRPKRKRRPDVDRGERLERRWHHADDRVWSAAQSHGSADGCPGSVEVPEPRAMAEHDGRRVLLVPLGEVSTCRGRHTQDTEVLRGNSQVADVLRTGRRRQRQPGTAASGGQTAEGGGVIGQKRAGVAIVGGPISRSGRLEARDRDETTGFRVRQRLHEGGIGDTEDGRRRGHAERDDEHTAGGEAGIPPQAADSEPEVLRQLIEESQAARLAAVVLRALHAAEVHPGAPRRFPPGQAGADQVVRMGVEVKPHLLVERVLEALPPAQRHQKRAQARERHVAPPGDAAEKAAPPPSFSRSLACLS